MTSEDALSYVMEFSKSGMNFVRFDKPSDCCDWWCSFGESSNEGNIWTTVGFGRTMGDAALMAVNKRK
jgi:hypothetical protein